jgi:outer membrane protein assembly factor BamB
MMKFFHACLALLLSLLLGGCGFFFGEEEGEQPAELFSFDEQASFLRLWRVGVGNGQGNTFNKLRPAIDTDAIYAISNNGRVRAFDLENGNRLWQNNLDEEITGGVGMGSEYLFVTSANASLIALDKNTGELVWQSDTSSEVLSVPASEGNTVVVQAIDGSLSAYDARSGERIWIYENTVPALTIRGTSSPLIIGNAVLAAFDNGVIVSVALNNGTLNWDTRIAIPTGRSEIERLTDVDANLLLDGDSLLVPSLHGYLSMLDINTGQIQWRVEESSLVGVSTGFGNIYLVDERGHVKAYRRGAQNPEIWNNDQLDLRDISAPVSFNNYVAVGDFEGYIHLLSQVDGSFVGRYRLGSGGLRSIQSRNGILYAYGNRGDLVALRIEAK